MTTDHRNPPLGRAPLPARQGARALRPRRLTSSCRERPHLGVRRRPLARNPGQGEDPDAAVHLLVPQVRRRREPPPGDRRGAIPGGPPGRTPPLLAGRVGPGRASARSSPSSAWPADTWSGSGWADYKKTGAVCGIPLPKGLREADRLAEPIFTPATKAEHGHDENVSFETHGPRPSRRRGRAPARPDALSLRASGRVRRRRGASSWPTPSSSSAASTGGSSGSTRRSRPTHPATGTPATTRRAAASRPSTSSSFATGWSRPAGTSGRRRPSCRKASCGRRGKSTWTPTAS